METPRTTELANAAGISKSHASDIINNKRKPSKALAIHIYRKTGWRHQVIAGLTEAQIDLLETVEPWRAAA